MTMFHFIRDRRGATALEFALVLFFLIMFIVTIFDASRYALTWYSVSNLAYEAVRRQTLCYSPLIAKTVKTVTCPSDPFSLNEKKDRAPALFWGNLKEQTVTTVPTDSGHVITASVTGFKPAWSLINLYPSTLTISVNLPF